MLKIFKTIFAIWLCIICNSGYAQPIALENAFPNAGGFSSPVFLTHSNDSTNRIFVVQQGGLIRVFPNDSNVTSASVNTFLNVTNKITSGGERGLLGLAFHPNYAVNGYFYLNYSRTGDGATIISRFTRSTGNPNKADSLSEMILLTIPQPFSNHNGGMVFFGVDGYLYIGMGDGGSAGDPGNRAQNLNELLGKTLRINVDTTAGGNNYGIPSTNPYAGGGGRAEIFTVGMRNPWRYGPDAQTGIIYCGDVGQGAREEINIIENGKNYGWRCYEGNLPYNTAGCSTITNYTFPIKDYARSLGYSVTGGYVYRGTRRPELYGRYIYGDYGSGRIWKLLYNAGNVSDTAQIIANATGLTAFGLDQAGELYMCRSGQVYRFNKNTIVGITDPGAIPDKYTLSQNYPNPFNPETKIKYSIPQMTFVRLAVYDAAGHEVRTLVNTTQLAGNYEIVWNGKNGYGEDVSSGVYFYVLSSNDIRESKRMMLIK